MTTQGNSKPRKLKDPTRKKPACGVPVRRVKNRILENHKVAAPNAIFRMVMRGAQGADGD
jgi:hypothetical protein